MSADLRSRTHPPRPLPYAFTVDGHTFTMPDHPSRWWVRSLASQAPGCWWAIVPSGLSRDEAAHLLTRLDDADDRFDLDDLQLLAEQVTAAILGMELWPAHRLLSIAYSNWVHLEAWTIQQGCLGLLSGHPAQIASAVYAWQLDAARSSGDAKKARQELTKLESRVWGPPPMHLESGSPRDMAPEGWDERADNEFMSSLGR